MIVSSLVMSKVKPVDYNVRRDLFYLLDYVTHRSEKSRFEKKKVRRQIGKKFPNIRHTVVPVKKIVMLLVCQILNICNYEVLFGLIYQKMVTCKCYPSSEN